MVDIEKKAGAKPSLNERKFSADFERKIAKQIETATANKHYIEAAFLTWSSIEQAFLPRLVMFIIKSHKLDLGENWIQKMRFSALIELYYCLSHDKELYRLLVECNAIRNRFTHSIRETNDFSDVENRAKAMLKSSAKLYISLVDRLQGEVPIPSLQLYAHGWNDARVASQKVLQDMIDELS